MLPRLILYSFGYENPKTTVLAALVSSGDFRAESISLPFSAPRSHLPSLACVASSHHSHLHSLLPVPPPITLFLLPPPRKEPCEHFDSPCATQDNLPISRPLVTLTVSFIA